MKNILFGLMSLLVSTGVFAELEVYTQTVTRVNVYASGMYTSGQISGYTQLNVVFWDGGNYGASHTYAEFYAKAVGEGPSALTGFAGNIAVVTGGEVYNLADAIALSAGDYTVAKAVVDGVLTLYVDPVNIWAYNEGTYYADAYDTTDASVHGDASITWDIEVEHR